MGAVTRAWGVVLLACACAHAADDAALKQWVRSRAAPLGAEGAAFRTLDADLAGVSLIGVGESFHEAEPFLAFRAQLLMDLVRRHAVTALVLESGLPEGMAADDYVHGRSETFEARMLPGLGHLAGVRHLLDELRAWNAGPGRERPVSVHGADLPARSGSLVPALDRLAQLGAGDAALLSSIEAVRPLATRIAHTWWKGATDRYQPLSAEEKASLEQGVARVAAAAKEARLPAQARDAAQRVAFVLLKMEEMLRLGAFHPAMVRNHALAKNALEVTGRLPAGQRAVFWAHNAHVQRVDVAGEALPPPKKFTSTGSLLSSALGVRYYAIGTAYGGPSLDKSAPLVAGSVDEALVAAAPTPYLVRLRDASMPGPVATWLGQEREMRFQSGHLRLEAARAFDALAVFETASRIPRAPR